MLLDPRDLAAVAAHAVPLVLLVGALLAGRAALPVESSWRIARAAVGAALLAALGALVVALALGSGSAGRWATGPRVVLLLIAFIGWVLASFSGTYLAGEPNQRGFVRWFLATLAGSSLVAATDHLGVLSGAWIATSLTLQRLLVFYPDRPNAQMAAHKKFLASRLADVCMLTAVAILASSFGTLRISELTALVAGTPSPGPALGVAVTLIAMAALLKSAQLPVQGWLIQVMEAPTPVSALLHAGVVNLGGFVLIRLGALLSATPAAQVLLVLVGSLTAVVAGLVTTTRISVKVALAWSTCAQMGFMVMQCGLGLYEMALLHLLAHSLYKAHAFLGAGSAVQQYQERALSPSAPASSATARIGAASVCLAAVLAVTKVLGLSLADRPALAAMAAVVALAATPLLYGRDAAARGAERLRGPAAACAVALLYFGLHGALEAWFGPAPRVASWATGVALSAWTVVLFLLLFAGQTYVATRGSSRPARLLYAWFYGGLFLDERFTRLTLRVWPVRLSTDRSSSRSLLPSESR